MYVYSEEERLFHCLGQVDYHSHCVLVVRHIVCLSQSSLANGPPLVLLCSAATDGVVAMWGDLGKLLLDWAEQKRGDGLPQAGLGQGELDCFAAPLLSFRAHQSGVNDIDVTVKPTVNKGENELILASVGDDNALVMSILSVKSGEDGTSEIVLLGQSSAFDAHLSAITGQQECPMLVCCVLHWHLLLTRNRI